jgi:tape measure domain-containing protein
MNRSARLNLLLGVDPSQFKQAIDKAVGGELRKVKINVDAQLDGAGDSFGRSAVAQISKATIKADFSNFVADQLATRIAKATGNAVEESVRKGFKGDLFGAVTGLIGKAVSIPVNAIAGTAKAAFSGILGSATATARTAFQGVVFGATQSASAELGAGISAGLQKALGANIGSPELIGRKIVENLSKAISEAALEEGINLPGIGAAVKDSLGEKEVLTDSRAKSAQDRQVRKQREQSAQVELNIERQEAARIQSEAIESYARIAQSVQRQSKELVEKNREAVNKLRSKLKELSAQGDGADKALENELKGQLNRLLAPLVELENLQKQARAQLNQEFIKTIESRENIAVVEGGDSYRSVLQKRAEKLNSQQLEYVDRIQALQETLAKGLKAEQALSGKLDTATDDEKPELLALQEEAKASINAIAAQINGLKKARTEITDEIEGLAQQAKAIPKGPNKVVVDILKELGFGDIDPENIPQIQLATDATLAKDAKADYSPEANLVRVRQELFNSLQTAQSASDLEDEATRRTIREEIAHSAQFDFGSAEGNRAFAGRRPVNQVSDPTAEDIQRLGPELQRYVKSGRGKDAQVELEAKVAADRLAEKTQSIEKQAKDLDDLEKTFGYAGTTVSKLLAKTVESERSKIEALLPQARELGDEAIEQVRALENFLDQLELTTREVLQKVAQAKTGNSPQIDVAKQKEILANSVRQLFGVEERTEATSLRLKEIAQRPPEPPKQTANLAIATEQVSELGGIVSRVSSVLSPIGIVAGGTVHALEVVGKAGLALADKLGFAAASLVPGGALAYGPAKEIGKFAAPALAAGALATQVPGAGEIISAISSAVSAVIGPATSGLSTSVGHAVSAEIAGALPSLFSALSRVVSESGLPGAQVTAAAVDKLGGGLVHLLEPVISGVAHTADSTIVGIGRAVNEFLGDVGGLLLAGKGLQEGVKLATNADARAGALDAIEQVGSGVGQTFYGIADGVENVKDAINRTKQAVERNVEEIKAGTQELAQGNVRAVLDIKDSAEAAVLNIVRGAQDVGKAVGTAGQEVKEGAQKVVDARPRLNIPEPDPWIQPDAPQLKAQAIELDIPRVTYDVPANVIDVEVEEVDLVVDVPKTKLDNFREQLGRLDEARDTKINEIREIYQELKKDVAKSKTAAKKGDVARLRELQDAIATKRSKILAAVDDLSQEANDILQALNALGVETGANTPIRDKIAALRQSLTKTQQGVQSQVAKTGSIPGVEPIDSLQALNIEPIQESIAQSAKSLSGAFKALVETIFEVQSETLAESLALAAQSPRGKDLAVNAAGLGASLAASSQGPVAGIAADLIGALAARQAVGGGGAETFGDLTGFITGNVTNAITGIPGSGALAASAIVPQLQKLKDQIQAKYGQPLSIDIPVELRLDSLSDLNTDNARSQVDEIDLLLSELRQLEAEGKGITPTVGERIRGFLGSIAGAFSKADAGEIAAAINKIEIQLARTGEAVNAQLAEEIQEVERNAEQLTKSFDEAASRLESSFLEFERIADKVDDKANLAQGRASVAGTPIPEADPNLPDPIFIAQETEDLGQFATRKITVDPTDEERGVVARKRLERDASERQINDALRRGKTSDGSTDEFQAQGDLAIASFEKNAAKFDAVAEQIENGSTKTQQAMRKAGETFSTFKQKIEENGGFGGILNKVGDSLNRVADKAGLPVGALGKLSGIIKGVGIAALAYIGITQLGDALVELGRRTFEVSTRMEVLQTQLKFVGGESNLPDNLKFIREESERLKRPIDQVTEGITQLSIATRDTSLEGRTQEIASVIGTLGRVYGLSNENIKSIQYQLGQTIRLGRAQGDELRSISDAGINVQGALEKVLGKSAGDVRKQLEAGQISATATVDALKLLADTAKKGLPEALKTSQAELDNLNRKFTDVAVLAGEKLKPVIVGGIGAIGTAIDLAVAGAGKLEPFFSAIGQALGLVLDIATPVVGAIAAIGGAIANDLTQGAAIPFQIIGAGLSEIRKGFDALESAASQALEAISSSLPSGLGEILQYANPVTIAIQALGFAIGINLVASITQSSIALVGTMIPALIGMATTIWTTVIPAIGAARVAALAFIATPLGATITAIAIAAALAAPHLDEMARAVSGLSQAQLKTNETAIAFNAQYTKGLDQLQKGIPLTAEKLKELKDGFAQNVREGKDTAGVAAILSANLDRLQANAEAAAKIQGQLADAMKKSTEAIKAQSKAIDSEYNERLAGLNESLAGQAITRERFDEAELDAQQTKTAKYVELYKTQGDSLRSALSAAQAQLSRPIPDAARAEVVKQVVELESQINDIETKSSEQRIGLAQNRVKRLEKIEKDRVDRAANEVKKLENQIATGVTLQREIELEQKISENKQAETKRRIAEINRQLKTEVSASGEVSEIAKNLYSERAVLETELTKIVSEQTAKRYEILLKDLEESRDKLAETIADSEVDANIELQNAQNAGLLKQAQVESKKTDITRDRLRKELALELANIEQLEALPSPTDPKKAEAHQKLIRAGKLKTGQLVQSLAENEYKRQQEVRQAAEKAIEEQVKGVENASNAIEQLGKIASNALDRQNKILEAQKSLRASIVGLHDEEFKILIETETNERDKADLQEKAAAFRLKSLRESQALEEKILEIQIAQEQVQNRVAILKAQAAVAKAEAEKAKVDANPESTDADKQAAALGLEASQIELGATVETARLQEQLAGFKRQQAQVDNRKELLGARFDYAKSIVDPSDREDAIERVRASAARGLRERNEPQQNPRFALPTPVNLHSGVGAQGLQLPGLSDELKQLRLLTQNGVAANLVALVSATERTNTYLSTMAGRQPVTVQRNNTTVNNNVRSSGGLPR